MSKVNTLKSYKCKSLRGKIMVPGDKSISHRALIISAISIGVSEIDGLLESEDVLHTLKALRSLGVKIVKKKKKYLIHGNGGIFKKNLDKLYFGNSGTGARLMIGLLATKNILVSVTGDQSLSNRPMLRVLDPLRKMGANFIHNSGKLPVTFLESLFVSNINYKSKIGSAQVKSAILLASLNIKGITEIKEEVPSRDHSEIMLRHFGAKIDVKTKKTSQIIRIHGPCILTYKKVFIPGDFSSAAFLIVATLLTKKSNLIIKSVGLNYFRIGLLEILLKMNAKIKVFNKHFKNGELIGDIEIFSSNLNGIKVDSEISARLIDEYPILFVACSFANGVSELSGLEELKFKESDRLKAMTEALVKCGVKLKYEKETLRIFGNKTNFGGCEIISHSDHRIAMAMLVFGMVSEKPVTIDDMSMIKTSFPSFHDLMKSIGARIEII